MKEKNRIIAYVSAIALTAMCVLPSSAVSVYAQENEETEVTTAYDQKDDDISGPEIKVSGNFKYFQYNDSDEVMISGLVDDTVST